MEIVPRAFLSALVSQYDAFIGHVIRCLFEDLPDLLDSSNHNIQLKELLAFDDIEDAKNSILEKEVETVLRSSHNDQIEWIERKLSCEIRTHIPKWNEFIEITERRNLFVHNNGAVNKTYVQNMKKGTNGFEYETSIGERLNVSTSYFRIAVDVLSEVGVKTYQIAWRKTKILEMKDLNRHLHHMTFEMLQNKKFEISKTLLDFALSPGILKTCDESPIFLNNVNYAIALRDTGHREGAIETMKKIDW